VGLFRLGSRLGEDRAGFFGRPKFQVFADTSDRALPALEACLKSPEVEAVLGKFTPVLIDASGPEESGAEAELRSAGFQVVLRGLDGGFLGGLEAGRSCGELVDLLAAAGASLPQPQESPICTLLRQHPEAIDDVVRLGGRAEAVKYVELLKEVEGESSDTVAAIQARLER
jgi:hypothetical protein